MSSLLIAIFTFSAIFQFLGTFCRRLQFFRSIHMHGFNHLWKEWTHCVWECIDKGRPQLFELYLWSPTSALVDVGRRWIPRSSLRAPSPSLSRPQWAFGRGLAPLCSITLAEVLNKHCLIKCHQMYSELSQRHWERLINLRSPLDLSYADPFV